MKQLVWVLALLAGISCQATRAVEVWSTRPVPSRQAIPESSPRSPARRGIVPSSGTLIWDESVILGDVFGRWGSGWGQVGRTIFLMVGVATLFSTQLAVVDGVARSISDILYTNFAAARKRELSWWYMVIAIGWIAVGILITAVIEINNWSGQLGVLFNAAYMGGFAMAIYVPLTLFMNLKFLPKSARPGPLHIAMMSAASLLYGGFAIYCIYSEIAARVS